MFSTLGAAFGRFLRDQQNAFRRLMGFRTLRNTTQYWEERYAAERRDNMRLVDEAAALRIQLESIRQTTPPPQVIVRSRARVAPTPVADALRDAMVMERRSRDEVPMWTTVYDDGTEVRPRRRRRADSASAPRPSSFRDTEREDL